MKNDRRIRILVVVNSVFGYDGISSVATNYYRYQNKHKVKMDLVTLNDIPKSLFEEVVQDGNCNYVIPCRNSNPIKYIYRLSKIVKENRYDIVYVHGNSSTMAIDLFGAFIAGCNVRVAHSHNTRCNHRFLNILLSGIFGLLYTDCCACSKEAGEFLFGKKKCYVVNNGLFLPKYCFNAEIREQIRAKYDLSQKLVLGHIGRFSYQKNQEFLLDLLIAMKKHSEDVALILVGEGETLNSIKETVVSAGISNSVIFYGTTDYVNDVVQAMDCFVFPSRFEGLGIVALEAQASGLNCVASDQVPSKMKVNAGTVFVSLDADVETWISAVRKSVVSEEYRKENRDKEKELFKAAGYDIEQNCKDMLDFYISAINKGET